MLRKAHISIDDVTIAFSQLVEEAGNLTSIYQLPFFRYLRKLHDRYDAEFTLYTYARHHNFEWTELPIKFCNEFLDASTWLKLGFHWISHEYKREVSEADIIDECQYFHEVISKVIGKEILTNTIRLHYYHPSPTLPDKIKQLDFFQCGLSLLCADSPTRPSYDLNEVEIKDLRQNKELHIRGRNYLTTDCRIERDKLQYSEIVGQRTFVAFTHEWALLNEEWRGVVGRLIHHNQPPLSVITKHKFKNLIRFLHAHKYEFIC